LRKKIIRRGKKVGKEKKLEGIVDENKSGRRKKVRNVWLASEINHCMA